MAKLLLREFLQGQNIIGVVDQHYPLSILGDVETINEILLINQGQKLVRPDFFNKDISTLVKVIVLTYRKKWDDLKLSLQHEIDILKTNTNKLTENSRGKNSYTDNTNSVDKVSAFNTNALIDNTGNIIDFTHNGNDEHNKVITSDNVSLDNAIKNLIIMGQLNIIEIIVYDVAKFLSLQIY